MSRTTNFLFLFLILSHICSAQIFSTRRLATENEIFSIEVVAGAEGLQEVLWFVSDPIEIERQIEVTKDVDMQKLMAKGKVKINAGKVYELAVFTNSASGLFESKSDSSISIKFEQEDDRVLTFDLTEPNAEGKRYYKLKYFEELNDKGETRRYLTYANDKWKVISGGSVKLEYKSNSNFDSKTKKTKIRGLRKDGTEKKGILGKIKKN